MTTIKAFATATVLLASSLPAYSQFTNCTATIMPPTGEQTKCSIPPSHSPYTEYPLTDKVTYQDQCADINGRIYYSVPSTISGNGQCMYGGDNQTLNQCGMSTDTETVFAQQTGQLNAMYLRGWDQVISCVTDQKGVCIGNGATCQRQGNFEQDIQYCSVAPCPKCQNCQGCQGCKPPGCQSPIVIDVLGEGMRFTSLESGVAFDFNGDGKPLYMAWTDPSYHNAWLALDRNGNGKIDSVQELFGAFTHPQIPSEDGKRSGWLALAIYDQPEYGGNGDGVIDANDGVYSKLLLWIDENHDGISQPEELHHLADMGITSISLRDRVYRSYKDEYGNIFGFESFITVTNHNEQLRRQAWDVVPVASSKPPDPRINPQVCKKNRPAWELTFPWEDDSRPAPDTLAMCLEP